MPRTKQADLKPVNWAGAEEPYRAGIRSLKSIGIEFGVSPQAVQKHFNKVGIKRDLKVLIHAAAQDLVLRAAVSVSAKEVQIIATGAQVLAAVQIGHRVDIARGRRLVMRLMAELEDVFERPDLYAMVYDALSDPSEPAIDALRDMARLVASLPMRVKIMRDLADAMHKLIGMEREAHGLDTAAGTDGRPLVIVRDFTGRGDRDAPALAVEPE